MKLPVEIQWMQLEYILDIKDIAACMRVCKLWRDIMRILNDKFRDYIKANLGKHTHAILSHGAFKSGPLARLKFKAKCRHDKPMCLQNKLKIEIGQYVAQRLHLDYRPSITICDNMLDIMIRGDNTYYHIRISLDGSIHCEISALASYEIFELCNSNDVMNGNMFVLLEDFGDLKVKKDEFMSAIRDVRSKYYST